MHPEDTRDGAVASEGARDTADAQTNKGGNFLLWPIRAFLRLPIDSTTRTILTAVGLCFVCSIFVSAAAVVLKPHQVENKRLDRERNILEVAGLMEPGADVAAIYRDRIQPRVVDLKTGRFTNAVDPRGYNQRAAARDPALSTDLPEGQDPAGIGRRANYASVYLVEEADGSVDKIILPVHGYGLWSTLYGFLAVAPDGNTIRGLQFYEHAETPGLGGEVDNPKWRALWRGKELFGSDGDIEIEVAKGDHQGDPYKVEALSGATLTSRGVTNLVRFWVSENGFGPFLKNLSEELSSHG